MSAPTYIDSLKSQISKMELTGLDKFINRIAEERVQRIIRNLSDKELADVHQHARQCKTALTMDKTEITIDPDLHKNAQDLMDLDIRVEDL